MCNKEVLGSIVSPFQGLLIQDPRSRIHMYMHIMCYGHYPIALLIETIVLVLLL